MNKYTDLLRLNNIDRNKNRKHYSIQIPEHSSIHSPPTSVLSLNFLELPDKPIETPRGLSSLSSRQNEYLNGMKLLEASEKSPLSLPLSSKLRKEEDYLKLIDKLDTVISNVHSHKNPVLYEGVPHEHFTTEGKIQHYRVEVQGKRCPMHVCIKRQTGAVITYYSKNLSEPSEASHDHKTRQDSFNISDSSSKFKTLFIGIGVCAITNTKYSISIKFGTHRASASKSINSLLTIGPRKRVLSKSDRSEKNFIELNMKPIPLNSPKGEHLVNFKTWNLRRQQAVAKKQEIYQEKQKKSILLLNRNSLMKEEQLRKETEIKLAKLKSERNKFWIILLNVVKAANFIQHIIKIGKAEKLRSMRRKSSAKRIQNVFRNSISGMSPQSFNLTKAITLILMYRCSYTYTSNIMSEIKISQFIRESLSVLTPTNRILRFREDVILIQKTWRAYSKVNRERIKKICQVWNQVYENEETKRRKKNLRFRYVSKQDREQIINNYLRMKKKEYLDKVMMYQLSRSFDPHPDFHYLPSKQQVLKLINNR